MYVFQEKQYFRKKFTFLLLVAISLFSIYMAFKYVMENLDGEVNIIQFFTLLFPLGIAFLIGNLTLNTKVDELGVHYQFFPFHLKMKLTKWSELKECYVREYNPITEFGGWGFRIGIFRRKGVAYSVDGKTGLQLELKNGKKILIGTQKKQELERVLSRYSEKIKSENLN